MTSEAASQWWAGHRRLPSFDYSSAGSYFVTICAYQRMMLFEPPQVREVIEWAWFEIPNHFRDVGLDAFVVMPNHVHGIVVISPADTAPSVGHQHAGALRRAPNLSVIVRSFKAAVTRELRLCGLQGRSPVWQSNYYDRVVRSDAELDRIREYIAYNPIAWQYDQENPASTHDEAHIRHWGWLENRRLTP